ncbi:unnamed protein product [Rotaria socialis]|uniref:Uncharacterized protein n=1 Tax=Rotaria socialis TaxID=392032 RepID=A0A817VUR0_9BILA|nr:unnamed protein product [Rotaria socialis]
MRGIAEAMYQIVKIIPRLPRTLSDIADSAAGALQDTPQKTEPTGRVTRSVRHNDTKQQGARVTRSVRHNNAKQQDTRGGRDDTSHQGGRHDVPQQGGRRDTTQHGGRGDTSLQPRKDVPQSSNCNNNRAAIIERDVKDSVVTINRRDYVDSKDIFARDASIVNETRQQKLFISDLVKFDIIQTSRGQETVNIKIIERNINSISKLPKIPKRAPNHEQQQQHISVEVFKSTIAELFKEALKR